MTTRLRNRSSSAYERSERVAFGRREQTAAITAAPCASSVGRQRGPVDAAAATSQSVVRPASPVDRASRGAFMRDASRVQQRALALDAPAIAGERAVAAHDAVARDRDRQRVGAAGLRDRAHRLRRADALRDARSSSPSCRPGSRAAPARRAAGRPCRERRAAGRARRPGASTKPTTLATSCSNAASPPISRARGKRSCRSRASASGSSPEQDGADAAVALRDQDGAQRALADREANVGVGAAGAVGASASCPSSSFESA